MLYVINQPNGQRTVPPGNWQQIAYVRNRVPYDGLYTGTLGGFRYADFDGTNDYVNTGIASNTLTASRTFVVWLNAHVIATANAGAHRVIQQATGNTATRFGISVDSSNVNLMGQAGASLVSAPIQADTWYHVAVTTDGTTHRLYVNGVESGSSLIDLADNTLDATAILIGAGPPGNSRFFNGFLRDVRIYSAELSASNVAFLYNSSGVNPGTAALEAQYLFNATAGTSVADASGNGNTGTALNITEGTFWTGNNAVIDLTTNVASPQSSSSGWATDWASAADNAALQTLIDGKHLVTFRGKAVMDDGGLFDDFFDDFFG